MQHAIQCTTLFVLNISNNVQIKVILSNNEYVSKRIKQDYTKLHFFLYICERIWNKVGKRIAVLHRFRNGGNIKLST